MERLDRSINRFLIFALRLSGQFGRNCARNMARQSVVVDEGEPYCTRLEYIGDRQRILTRWVAFRAIARLTIRSLIISSSQLY